MAVQRRGNIELGKRLGAGAFGTVHKGRDLNDNRSVAVKVVKRNRDEQHRILREVEAMRSLQHVRFLNFPLFASFLSFSPPSPLPFRLLRASSLSGAPFLPRFNPYWHGRASLFYGS